MRRTRAAVRVALVGDDSDGVPAALEAADDGLAVEAVTPGRVGRLDGADCAVVTDPEDVPDAGVPVVLYVDASPADVDDPERFAGYARRGDPAALADQIRWVTRGRRTDASRIRRLHEGASDLISARSERELYERTVAVAARLLRFDNCFLGVADGDEVVPAAEFGDVQFGGSLPLDGSVAGETLRTGESVLVRDVATHPEAAPRSDDFRSAVSVPVGDDGVLQAVSNDPGAFDGNDVRLGELLASYVATTRERVRLEAELRGREERIQRLHEGTTELTAARSPDELFESAVDIAASILEFDQCYVGVREGDEVVPRAATDDTPAGSVRPLRVSEGIAGKTVRTGESFLLGEMGEDGDARPGHDTFRSGVSVPVDGVGVFQAVSTVPGAFDAADLELAELLAGHVAVVHERIRAERDMREERDRLAALFENVPDAAVAFEFVDDDPVVRAVNTAFERVFGYGAEEVVGESLDGYIVPSDPEARQDAADLNETLKRGESVKRECRRVTRTGDREFLLHVIPLQLGETNVAGYAIYTDITERDRRERLLSNLHETSRELMRADSAEEVYDIAIEAIEYVFGYPVSGLRIHDEESGSLELVAATDAVRRIVNLRPSYSRGESVEWEVYETGEPRVFAHTDDIGDEYDRTGVQSAMYLPVGDHGVLSFGSVRPGEFTDSTRQVGMILAANVEAALSRAERTSLLRERERELRRQNERLEEFASIVSHDLRNPLSVARGYLDLAEERGDDDAFDRVRRALDRMDSLIENVLSLARKGQVVGETTAVDAIALAAETWAGVDTAGAELETTGRLTVDADAERLRDLFANLFRNSVEHGSTGSRATPDDSVEHGSTSNRAKPGDSVEHAGADVTVGVGPLDDGDTDGDPEGFYVEDDGPGIPPSEREKVFEPGHTTGEDGIGFGLPIVRRIAEAHGWTVDLTESADGGARFEVRTGDAAAD